MKKTIVLLTFVLIIISNSTVYANTDGKPKSYEEMYLEWGYIGVDEAISEFENHCKKDLKLPLRIPPLAFTHQFGIFNDMDDDMNNSVEVIFVSNQHPENHYKVDMRPAKNRIKFTERDIEGTYKLNDWSPASYISLSPNQTQFYGLVFEKNNWQYILSIDERVADTITPEILIEIANSIDYDSKK